MQINNFLYFLCYKLFLLIFVFLSLLISFYFKKTLHVILFSKELKLLVLNIVYILNVSLFNNSFTIFIIFFAGLLIAANPAPMARLRLLFAQLRNSSFQSSNSRSWTNKSSVDLFYRLNVSKNIKNVSFEGLKTNN